jgi:dipeptidyl aminopeptidase/acylaminoacyl peptidase
MSTRTMQPDDLFEMQFLNGGKLSPDGIKVIYYVNHVDTEADKELSTIYLFNIATGETRPMTNGKAKDANPRWSPDGKSIAFISDRNDKPQLFILPVDGGEAQQVTDLKQGVGGFAWSPDGNKIAFTAGPDFDGDQPRDLTKEVYRVKRTVYRFDAMGYLDDVVNNLYVLNVASGEVTQLTDDDTHNSNPRWSPDGTKILYDATMQTDVTRALYPVLTLIDLDGNNETILDDWGETFNANFTPDGKKVVFVGQPDRGQAIGSKSDLHVFDLETGLAENRSDGLIYGVGGGLSMDMPVMGLRTWNVFVSADSNTAYAPVQIGGNVHIYAISLSGDELCEPVIEVEGATALLDVGENKILYALTTFNQPPNVWLRELSPVTSKQLTSLNSEFLSEIDLPSTQRLTWASVDGVEVEGWYMKPTEGDAPYPTILYIHGGPHAAYGNGFNFDFQMLAGAGYGVLFLNHRASTGYGDSFSTAIKGDWGNLDYNDLMTGVDHAIELGLADADRLGVCGTSGGGNLSCWIVGHTDRFKAAIPQNPVSNWRSFYGTSDIGVWFAVEQMGGHPHEIPEVYEKSSPIIYAHNCTTPTLMVQSEHDWRCPAEQSEQFYAVLKANGCTVEMLRQPGGSHGASNIGAINLRRAHNEAMLDWFEQYVLAE